MADLTADAPLRIWGEATTEHWQLDSSAAQTVYKGQPMIIDQSADTVYLKAWVDSEVAATDIFVGIAAEGKSILIGASETDKAAEIEVYTQPTILGFKSAVYTDADVGDTVYMSDSATLSATPGDNPKLGILHRVVDGYAYVQLVSPSICTGA